MTRLLVLIAGAALMVASGCTDGEAADGDATLVVSAAASLTEAFTEVAAAFEATHEGASVDLNFGASSQLATQIVEGGAPVDVFASANGQQMQRLLDSGDAADPQIFAQNQLVVAVPQDSGLALFEDLAAPGVRLVLAASDVPIGAYAREALAAASASGRYGSGFEEAVLDNVVSEEANVRQVLAKVELGEADAGIVYATDAIVSGDVVRVIPVPEEFAPLAVYPIAVVAGSGQAGEAHPFVDFVLSEDGRAILERHGFLVP